MTLNTQPGKYEKFKVKDMGSNKIALKTTLGNYVGCNRQGATQKRMEGDGSSIGAYQTFEVFLTSNCGTPNFD